MASLPPKDLICNACLLRVSNAPIQAIIHKNSQALLRRQIRETKEKIKTVMDKVNNLYSALVQNEIDSFPNDEVLPSFEYISDINQLKAILKDEVKKELYQKQVTVFIVGHSTLCENKLQLINQLNEFFILNSKLFIEDTWQERIGADIDFDKVSLEVKDSLTTTAVLSNRLSEINKEMIQYFTNQATQDPAALKFKGKKRLEKAIQIYKEENNGLQEKLKQMSVDMKNKEEQLTEMNKQLTIKKNECQEFQMAASMINHYFINIQTLEKAVEEKNYENHELQLRITDLEFNIRDLTVISSKKLDSLIKKNEENVLGLKEKLEIHDIDLEEALETADALHKLQMEELYVNHREEIVQFEMNQEKSLLELMEAKGSHKEGSQKGTTTKKSKSVTKQKSKGDSKTGKSSKSKDVKENTDSSQASGASAKEKGESTAKATKTQSKLSKMVKQAPVETAIDHSVLETLNAFELTDNEAWAGLPSEQMPERFVQYRWLTTKKLNELDEQLRLMTLRTQRKVESLKSQFQEHKVKWEEERELLKQQVVQLKGLQVAAEKEADAVMTQLEDFINEQEKMDTEENIDHMNVGEESKHSKSADSKKSDLLNAKKLGDPLEDKVTTTCVSDSAISVTSYTTIDSHLPKTDNFKVMEPINISDQNLKSPIIPASDINTCDRSEIQTHHKQSSTEEVYTKMRGDTELKQVRIQFPQALQEISEDLNGDGDKNVTPVSLQTDSEDSINVKTDSTCHDNQLYKIILKFKENLTKLIGHKDLKYAKEIIADIDSIIKEDNTSVDSEKHSDEILKSIQQTFKDITQLIYDQFQQQQVQQLTNKNNPSLEGENSTTDSQRQTIPNGLPDKGPPNNIALRELMDLYNQLQNQIIEDTQKHEVAQRHNTVVIMDMKEKINTLQQQLNLARKVLKTSSQQQYAQYEPPVMFTRLDLERNAKVMTRAVASQHLSNEKFKNIIKQMENYISLPVLRFQQLVHRYVHHCRLKKIYDYITNHSKSNPLHAGTKNGDLYLQKYVNIHNQCANRWCEQVAVMGLERQSQASALTETLADLETESGLFLIKPIFSNRVKAGTKEHKLHRQKNIWNKIPNNSPNFKQSSTVTSDNSFGHGLKSNFRPDSYNFEQQPLEVEATNFFAPNCRRPIASPMWAISMSQSSFRNDPKNTAGSEYNDDSTPKAKPASVIAYGNMSTAPRILELDINRMLIGQNNVSIKINPPSADESEQMNLRSYLNVCRTTGIHGNRLGCSLQPLSNITNSYYEVQTPPVSRRCTPNVNHGEQLIQIDQIPTKSELEKTTLPPI